MVNSSLAKSRSVLKGFPTEIETSQSAQDIDTILWSTKAATKLAVYLRIKTELLPCRRYLTGLGWS